MLNVMELKDARKIVKDNLVIDTEIIPIELANNRVLASDILSSENIPQFKRSIVDGYAIIATSSYGASQAVPAINKLLGEVKMGEDNNYSIKDNECYYTPTGAKLVNNADSVVMIENTTKLNDEIFIYQPVKHNENVINIGEDIKENEIILKKGSKLNAAKIGILAGAGISSVNVYKKQKFFIISTGDEIIPIDQQLSDTKIRDINSYIISTKLEDYGIFNGKVILKDDKDLLENTIKNALKDNDVIFVSGGSSVGIRDYTYEILSKLGDVIVRGLALKPGKPTMVAKTKNNKLIIGLPGHPMAALMALQLVYLDAIDEYQGNIKHNKVYAKASVNFPSSSGRATIMPVSLSKGKDGLLATPKFYKSGLINILAQADGYIIIPTNEEGIEKDTLLEVTLL